MSDVVHALRKAADIAARLGGIVERLSAPWLLLGCRLWLGQLALVQQAMAMMAPADHISAQGATGYLGSVLWLVAPFCLMAGILTRPIAAALLLRAVLSTPGAVGVISDTPAVALLFWLVAAGAGPLSLDRLLGYGLARSAFGPGRLVGRLYGALTCVLRPVALLCLRVEGAALLVVPAAAMAPGLGYFMRSAVVPSAGWHAVVAAALAIGFAARPVAAALAAIMPLGALAMTMDDRLTVLLILLSIASSGAGLLSVDRLILRWVRTGRADRDRMETDLPHVVVVGGGFAGIAAAQGLRHARCRVTLIDRRNHHLFQPLLYQVATAALSPAEIATPIRSFFRNQANVRVHLGEVTGVDTAAREVLLGATRVRFDYLVLATGARHSYFGQNTWASCAPGLKSIEDATAIRSRLLRAFEEAENAVDEAERTAWLTFVIVGGGPTGVELAGAIAELARHGLEREYRTIDPATAQVILVQSAPRILPTFDRALSAAAERSLRQLGVEVRLDSTVREIDSSGVTVGDQRLAARTVLWAAGVAASPAAQWLGSPSDRAGRAIVDRDLSVKGFRGVYAAGDTAACQGWHGTLVPGLAPAAKQAGRYIARVIGAALEGHQPPPAFQYRHVGSLATIGRKAAVVELGWVRLWGAPAWWFWGAAHLTFLVGGRNKATVILNWLWAYLTYRQSTRLITGDPPSGASPTA